MQPSKTTSLATRQIIGDEAPIPAGGRRRAPDRREVSIRWLSGTFLTGVTSTVLMGVALFAALDGKQLLAIPPEVYAKAISSGEAESDNAKTSRVVALAARAAPEPKDRQRMSVSTVTRVGDADVIRTKPFEHLKISLAAGHQAKQEYPPFNPLAIFADSEETQAANQIAQTIIYGAEVETEASVRIEDFRFEEDMRDSALSLSDEEVEEIVRSTAPILTDGTVEVATLHYVDPARFGNTDPALAAIELQQTARIVPQNVSIASQDTSFKPQQSFDEDLVFVEEDSQISTLLAETNYDQAAAMAEALATLLQSDNIKAGHVIRLGLQGSLLGQSIIRCSIYDGNEHVLTIALNDKRQFVPAQEPVDQGILASLSEASEDEAEQPVVRDLPRAYDAIYRGILAYDLPNDVAAQIVRMVAADVDFNSAIKPTDRLELFYSLPEEADAETGVKELLFVEASFGDQTRKFYRFGTEDGSIDYFDENGRSARQFLLRNPVPTGRFRSPFGMRVHPILKYRRMHWGVDWSAPRGTPIIAPGNGVVKKTGWGGGYGRQLIVTHPNGYETLYAHLSGFAKGVEPGARVRQGQVIAYVGNTGLSTGPHLHYEMRVNGKRVDPLRVRLPQGKTLEGAELEAFISERDRINNLLQKTDGESQQVAQVQG